MEDNIELALRGKTFSKVKIVDASKSLAYLRIHLHDNKLIICYISQFHCDPVDVTIDELVLNCPISSIPEFLLEQASCIRILGDLQSQLPPKHRHKFKRNVYSTLYWNSIVPNCTYHALGVSELMRIDLKLVSCLTLTGNVENLMDMVKYVVNNQESKFRKVSIRHIRFNSSFPFDMSLAANIDTDMMYFNNGPFCNFRKFISETAIPCVRWATKEDRQSQLLRCREIAKELATEAEANIEDNFTLTRFTGTDVYWSKYKDVRELAARNAEFALNRRFKTTKLAAPSE